MSAGVYFSFKTESMDAMKFYEDVFGTKREGVMTFGEMPEGEDNPFGEEANDLVLNAAMTIHGMSVMFSDVPEAMGPVITGSNVAMVLYYTDPALLTKEFNALADGGQVIMPLEKTFWSEKYGYAVDKFGIHWQIVLN